MSVAFEHVELTYLDGLLVGILERIPPTEALTYEEAMRRASTWMGPSREDVAASFMRGAAEEWRGHWSRGPNDGAIGGFKRCDNRTEAEQAIADGLAWAHGRNLVVERRSRVTTIPSVAGYQDGP